MEPRIAFTLRYVLVLLGVFVLMNLLVSSGPPAPEIAYSEFVSRIDADEVETVVLTPDRIYGVMRRPETAEPPAEDGSKPAAPALHTPWHPLEIGERVRHWMHQLGLAGKKPAPPSRFTVAPVEDASLVGRLERHHVDFGADQQHNWLGNFLLNWVVPFGLMAVLWMFLMRRMGSGPARMTMSMGRSNAKLVEVEDARRTRFSDVAGVDEAVTEVAEVVDFLQHPERYTRLGAKLPKGVLLVGPPGTGKTLLARAVAGEAGVPFFQISGSDFVEMFVGVGAARVRDLFAEATKAAPCIVFIDELDAVGRRRRQGALAAGTDEAENTLNQLLVEMDGFDPTVGVVLIGATNRPEVLDPALLRPGRFDRQVLVDRPDRDGRLAILQLHARGLELDPDVDLSVIATRTPGMVGADLANLCNEAALLAARAGRQEVEGRDFDEALERVIGGVERRSRVLHPTERRTVAIHESGHALVSHLTPGVDPVQKVSIVPRGRGALGYTLQAPLEDRFLLTQEELEGRLRVLLAGRAAELEVRGVISTGAADDLQRAAQHARQMITRFGMGSQTPNLSLVDDSEGSFLGRSGESPHSDALEREIEAEVALLIAGAYREARELVVAHRAELDAMAERLLDSEKLELSDIVDILGPGARVGAG